MNVLFLRFGIFYHTINIFHCRFGVRSKKDSCKEMLHIIFHVQESELQRVSKPQQLEECFADLFTM